MSAPARAEAEAGRPAAEVETINLGKGRYLEIGPASWDAAQTSIRCTHAVGLNGTNPIAIEVSLTDLRAMVEAAARRDLIGAGKAALLIEDFALSIARQTGEIRTLREMIDSITPDTLHDPHEPYVLDEGGPT